MNREINISNNYILKKHNLRITDCRLSVLNKFREADHALSTRELEEDMGQYDRVTLYRTLHSFTEKGVLHRIPDDSGFARYGLCNETCSPKAHQHDHIHFKCDDCGNLECLSGQNIPTISIPGYMIKESNFILSGICKQCVNRK